MNPTTSCSTSRRRRFCLFCLAPLLFLGLIIGGWMLYGIHVQYRLGTVSENQVYKSATMPPAAMAALAQRLHLRSVIDLRTTQEGQDSTNTSPGEDIVSEATALAAVGVKHIHLPSAQVPDQATVDRFLTLIRDPAHRPTLIHCYHGIGRTELFCALYRIECEGWNPEDARLATRFIVAGSSFSANADKGRFLKEYRPQRLVAAVPPKP